MVDKSKRKTILLRISHEEKQYIESKAKHNGLAISEYVRIRILETSRLEEEDDSQDKNQTSDQNHALTTHDKYMMEFMVNAYYILGKLARTKLNDEDMQAIRERANQTLEGWGYK